MSDYTPTSLRRADLSPDPLAQFAAWLADAKESEPNDPSACALATVDASGAISQRMVLLKDFGQNGLVFFTNFDSRKGRALQENPTAALLFHWKSRRRQVRVEGAVAPISAVAADAYFATRPRDSQLGAWASAQSRKIADKAALMAELDAAKARFGNDPIARPDYWSGFCVTPQRWEFWQDGAFRLHDRFQYDRSAQGWNINRLNP